MNFEIKTERLILRQPCIEDVNRLYQLMSEVKLTHYLTWEPHRNIETTKAVVQSLIDAQNNDRGYHWCVYLNDEIIGLVSLIDVKRKIRTWTIDRAELSYWIGINYHGNGYATEAGNGVIDFGFLNLNLHKIIVAHAKENIESKNICTKLNFTLYAIEHDAFQKNNIWYDLIWYELIKTRNGRK